MQTVRLPSGEHAPAEADCISIYEGDGGFVLNGSVLLRCGDSNELESVSLIGGPTYPTRDAAEAAGLAWAADHCVETLYVSDSPFTINDTD
jgi:hypothetical protein